MIKLEKDVLDFHMNLSILDLRMEISKNERFINNHPRIFRYPKDETDFYLLKDRIVILKGIFDFRTNQISEKEFNAQFDFVR
ncbi:hypothetical protein SAMN05661099_1197 [Daejeonella lutea]|uniref:Uncharacterized protein n=1 Tax=Daejeonella lutea TaxID=572036 RepID=A0A1T5B160_9SPHI|nr:hypothetical protein SAMN05661099_1197 [Daejeonella lutea]